VASCHQTFKKQKIIPDKKGLATKSPTMKVHPEYKDLAMKSLATQGHKGNSGYERSLATKDHLGYQKVWWRKVIRDTKGLAMKSLATKGHSGYKGLWQRKIIWDAKIWQ
jgi:hypothetical protein